MVSMGLWDYLRSPAKNLSLLQDICFFWADEPANKNHIGLAVLLLPSIFTAKQKSDNQSWLENHGTGTK